MISGSPKLVNNFGQQIFHQSSLIMELNLKIELGIYIQKINVQKFVKVGLLQMRQKNG